MASITFTCDGCGAVVSKSGSGIYLRARNFCTSACRATCQSRKDNGKYIRVSVNGRKGVRQHRLVVEKSLGITLGPDDVVHHIDGNGRNNDPSNLAVLSRPDHQALHRPLRFDIERAKTLYESGLSLEQVAAQVGANSWVNIQCAFKRRGIPLRPPGRRLTVDIDAAYALYCSGLSSADVAQRIGVNVSSLTELFRRRGLALRTRGESLRLRSRR